MNEKISVFACRGDREYFPENTIPAFKSAITKGADGIEFDVHFTADKKLIVHHFFNLGHTDNGEGLVSEQTLTELQALDSGSWFGSQFRGITKPTLHEVLTCCKGKIRFEIDLKDSSLEFLHKVMNEVQAFDLFEEVEFTSAHYPLLLHAKKINPQINTGTFFYQPPEWMPVRLAQKHTIDWAILLKINVIHLNIALMDPDFIEKLHQPGFIVYGSNLDNEEQIHKGIAMGIDRFSTGSLALAVRLRNAFMAKEA